MFDESTISLAALAIAFVSVMVALAAVIGTFRERQSQRRNDDLERRRQLVGEVLEKLDRVARLQSRPVFGRLWAKPELEFALAMPKLELLVEEHEQPIVEWLNLQIRHMHRASSDGRAAVIGIRSAAALAEWFRGNRPLSWFETALFAAEELPIPPAKRTVWRHLHTSFEAMGLSVLTVFVASLSLAFASKLEQLLTHMRARR